MEMQIAYSLHNNNKIPNFATTEWEIPPHSTTCGRGMVSRPGCRQKVGSMFKIIGMMFVGVGIGYALRKVRAVNVVGKTIPLTIYALLCLLGITVGANSYLVSHLGDFGGQALLLAVLGLAGSMAATVALSRWTRKGGGK